MIEKMFLFLYLSNRCCCKVFFSSSQYSGIDVVIRYRWRRNKGADRENY